LRRFATATDINDRQQAEYRMNNENLALSVAGGNEIAVLSSTTVRRRDASVAVGWCFVGYAHVYVLFHIMHYKFTKLVLLTKLNVFIVLRPILGTT
jgi:hypothetical protein